MTLIFTEDERRHWRKDLYVCGAIVCTPLWIASLPLVVIVWMTGAALRGGYLSIRHFWWEVLREMWRPVEITYRR